MDKAEITVSSNVPPVFVDWNVLDYMTTRFPYIDREAWRSWIEAGHVQKDGGVCTLETRVTAGNLITCLLPEWEMPGVNLNFSIIYEDEWLMAINKPANLRVHSGGIFMRANMMFQLKHEHDPPYPDAELINRLDAFTSGVVFVAKSKEVVKAVQQLFQERQVDKQYLALVHGVPEPAAGLIDQPVGKVPDTRVRFGIGADVEKPKEARTRYRVEEAFGDQFALVRLWPETGRTHQLRVHMAALGHPLVGDKLYLSRDDAEFVHWSDHPAEAADADLIRRQALHCAEMGFVHPFTERPLTIEAPLPEDMQQLIEKLRK